MHHAPGAIVVGILVLASDDPSAGTQDLLIFIDQVVSALSAGLMVCLLLWLSFRRGCDPLRAAPPRPNKLREDTVALAICVYFTAALLSQGVIPLVVGTQSEIVSAAAAGLSSSGAGIVICFVLAARHFDGGVRRFLVAEKGIGVTRTIALTGAVAFLAVGLCPVFAESVEYVVHRFIPGYEFPSHPTIESLHDEECSWLLTGALWVGAVLLAPVAEECFFRGLLQTLLVRVFRHRWAAIVVTSASFGLIHFQQPQAILPLAVLSVLIGYAYERTGSLLPPIMIHAIFNLKTLIWNALGAFPALTPVGN